MLSTFAQKILQQRLKRPFAVITIDVQNSFLHEDGGLARLGFDTVPLRAILPEVARLHSFARSANSPLIHVRSKGGQWLNWPRRAMAPRWLERMEQSKGAPGIVSGEGNDIDFAPEAMPHAGETVLTKHVQDAFNGTPLLFMLAQMQAETVILSGLTTEGCVETTARTAFNHGFAVV
ncbi:MAG: hypothetical protein A2289_14995, partial [Deltaproteobacteria bacterium RIFOXYA12_FULL_58_15]